jgi:hypothetical protein
LFCFTAIHESTSFSEKEKHATKTNIAANPAITPNFTVARLESKATYPILSSRI